MANIVAPEGSVFVCLACGKTSRDKYGFQSISYGWDEACVMHAEMFPEGRLVFAPGSTRVIDIREEHD